MSITAGSPQSGSIAVFFSPANPAVNIGAAGTLTIKTDPGYEIGSIRGINSSISVYLSGTAGTLRVGDIPGSLAVYFSPSIPTVISNAGTGTRTVKFDPGYTLGKVDAGVGTFNVQFDPGHTLGIIDSITKTVAVYFDRGSPAVAATFSGSIAAVPTTGSGNPIYEENYNAGRVFFAGSNPNSSLVVNAGTGTFNVALDPGHTIGLIDSINKTVNVQLDPGHELGSIKGINSSINVFLADTGHELGTIRGNTNTLTVFLPDTGHSIGTIQGITTSVTVFHADTGHTIGKVDAGTGTFQIFLPDTGHTIGFIQGANTTIGVWIPDTGHEIGQIRGITNSIAIHHLSTGGTLAIKIDPGYNVVNMGSTFLVPNFSSGSLTGISLSGNTIAAPAANVVRKVYAYNFTSSATLSNIVANITNGAGTSPTKYTENWLNGTIAGNAITPPGYLFAIPASTTMSVLLSNAAGPTHYNIYWFNESA